MYKCYQHQANKSLPSKIIKRSKNKGTFYLKVFGVCCNNTVPDELPEEPVNEEAKIDDENDAIVDDFPIEAQSVRRNCGFRSVPGALPVVTLYNQSPVPSLYSALLPQSYIVNGQQAIPHEYPWMV